jgi:hypothetical protein
LLGTMIMLAGCLTGLPVPTDKASEHFEIEYIETHRGSTRHEVVQKLGVPNAIFRSKGKTYYVYDATGDARFIIGAVFVAPPYYLPFWTPKAEGGALHCLALIFDERGLLQDYIAKTAPQGAVVAVVLPPPGVLAAEGVGKAITNCASALWNDEELAQFDIVPQYTEPQFMVGRAVAFGEVNGVPLIVAADGENTLRFWDLRTDRLLERALNGHQALVTSVVYGQLDNNPLLVTGSVDKTVRRWDLQTGRLLGEPLRGHKGRVVSVALMDVDGVQRIFSAAEDNTVRVWDAHSGALLEQYALEGQPVAMCDAGGKPIVVASGFDHSLYLWDLLAGHVIGEPLPGHEGLGTAVGAGVFENRAILASGAGDNTLRILDAVSGKPLREPLRGHKQPITNIAIGKIGVTTAVVSVDESNTLLLWDLAGTGVPMAQLTIATDPQIAAVKLFDLDGVTVIATSSSDHNVRLWDALRGKLIGNVMWFDINMKRAEQGDPQSQMLVYRHLMETHDKQGLHWLCRAADNGYFPAQVELGRIYWRGSSGINKDLKSAYVWYSLASRQGGDEWDVWELRAVTKEMTQEQQAEAEARLDDFRPGQCEGEFSAGNMGN